MSLLLKNIKRKFQGKEPIVNTAGQTREKVWEEENEEDTAPKAVNLDIEPAELSDLDKESLAIDWKPLSEGRSHAQSGGRQVTGKTRYDPEALKRLAKELEDEGGHLSLDHLEELKVKENAIVTDTMRSIGHQKISMADVVIVSVGSKAPPLILKNRVHGSSSMEVGAASKLLNSIASKYPEVDVEIQRDQYRKVYSIYLEPDLNPRGEASDGMTKALHMMEPMEKYVLVKGVPQWTEELLKKDGYGYPLIKVFRSHHPHGIPAPADLLSEVSSTGVDVVLSFEVRRVDLPLDLTVVVDMDPESVLQTPMVFCRQGTFPDDDKISRVVVDLEKKSSDGKQPAIDEGFITQVNEAFDAWDDLEIGSEQGLMASGIMTSAIGPGMGGTAISCASVAPSAVGGFLNSNSIPHTKSHNAHSQLIPGAVNWGPLLKEYASERALEISEAVVEQALSEQQAKIRELEKRISDLEPEPKTAKRLVQRGSKPAA